MRSVPWQQLLPLLVLNVLIGGTRQAEAQVSQVIGRAISPEPDLFVRFDQPDPDYDIAGDMFGIRSRNMPDAPDCLTCPGLPFSIVDQTFDLFDPFPRDRMGLIRSEDFDAFFGVVDTANDVGERLNTASWTFAIAGFTDLLISADMAAMGDFEAGDIERGTRDAFAFDYSIDGGPFEFLFVSSVDTEASLDYEMELPDPDLPLITLDDPLAMNGVVLSNVFQTLTAAAPGTGSELEVRFRAIADGADEVFAFRNLLVEGVAETHGDVFGDYNNNGLVEQQDLDLVLAHWGDPAAPPPDGWTNDLPDGNIDQPELDRVLANWGTSTAAALTTANVPEPSGIIIALLVIVSPFAGRSLRSERALFSPVSWGTMPRTATLNLPMPGPP